MDCNLKNVINAISMPILVVQAIKDTNGTVTDFVVVLQNIAFKKTAQYALEDDLLYSRFKEKMNPDVPWFEMGRTTEMLGKRQETTYYSPENHVWFHVTMNRTSDDFLVITFRDITKDHKHSQELREIAYHDKLTSLPNRNCVSEAIEVTIDTSRYENNKFALMLIDIDNMKKINDASGHQSGDELLVRSAQILKRFQQPDIAPFRTGGDEFLIIISGTATTDTIKHTAYNIFNAFSYEHINISCGVSLFPDDSDKGDELLRYADMAGQNAKLSGKNRLTFFLPDMQRTFINKVSFEKKITAAVLACDFTLNYQPQFDIPTGKLRGFEALIRWHDTNLGNVPPAVFIPTAEETGLIIPLGKWVLGTAFAALKNWQNLYNFTGVMSVNVSPVQLKQSNFISELSILINKYHLDPSTIEIEITEGVMIDDTKTAIEKLNKIKSMGLRVSLDDFGTGYSSLNYLQSLPLTTLKIDKSFINNITDTNGVQANITNSIINMVAKMGLETIAEGVEEPAQLVLLKKFHCQIIQGFLRGMPMNENDCTSYLAGNTSVLQTTENQQAVAAD
jgi:diguanylate cyclase (GGDEF)-like protein